MKAPPSELLQAAMTSGASDRIHITDDEGNIVMCDQAFADSLGYTLAEAHSLNVTQWDTGFSVDELPELVEQLLEQPLQFDTQHKCKDGTSIDVEVRAHSFVFRGDRYIFATSRPNDARVRASAEIDSALQEQNELRQKLTDVAEAKTSFFSRMSHELRTPLTVIVGVLDLLEQDPSLDDSVQRLVTMGQQAGQSQLAMIEEVLAFGRLEAGKLSLVLKPIDIHHLMNRIEAEFQVMARERGINLVVNISGVRFPERIADELRLTQIFRNLLSNAIKFSETGPIHLRVREDAEFVVFEVEDSGIGMDEDALRSLFEPFQQADSSVERKFGGTGLGMSITRELVELMSGGIEVHSELGRGTRFLIRLPLAISEDEAVPAITSETETPELDSLDFSGLNILLVEDQTVSKLIFEAHLWGRGIDIVWARHGREAVDLLESGDVQPDIIFMDLRMPVMGGREATRLIRASDTDLSIVAMSAEADQSMTPQLIEEGFTCNLPRPYSSEQLLRCLSLHCTRFMQDVDTES